jgi:hypothetical protein
MEIPANKVDMMVASYSPYHVGEIYKEIKPNTLSLWLKNGIIEPAVPAAG